MSTRRYAGCWLRIAPGIRHADGPGQVIGDDSQ